MLISLHGVVLRRTSSCHLSLSPPFTKASSFVVLQSSHIIITPFPSYHLCSHRTTTSPLAPIPTINLLPPTSPLRHAKTPFNQSLPLASCQASFSACSCTHPNPQTTSQVFHSLGRCLDSVAIRTQRLQEAKCSYSSQECEVRRCEVQVLKSTKCALSSCER